MYDYFHNFLVTRKAEIVGLGFYVLFFFFVYIHFFLMVLHPIEYP